MSDKVKFKDKVYSVYNLNDSSRFLIDDDLMNEEDAYATYPMVFVFDIDQDMAAEAKEEHIEVQYYGFDGDDTTNGELLLQVLYKDKQLKFVKIWMTVFRNESIDLEGIQVIENEGKHTLQIFVSFSCELPDFSGFLESGKDLDEFIEDFYKDEEDDETIRYWFIENGVKKINIVGLSNIKYGNIHGQTYHFAAESNQFIIGDIVFNKDKGDVYLVTSPSKVMTVEDYGHNVDFIIPAGKLFESKQESDKKVLQFMSFKGNKATPSLKRARLHKQHVDLEKLANSMTSKESIMLVGVTIGSSKKIYYVASSGLDVKLNEQVMCGKEKEAFMGIVKEAPKEHLIADIHVPLSRLYYIHSKLGGGGQVNDTERDFALRSVRQNGVNLKNVPKQYKDDFDVVLEAVKNYGKALNHSSEGMKNNKTIVLAAVKQDPVSIKYASESLRDDKEVVMTAVERDGNTLEYASNELRHSRDIVLHAVKSGWQALHFANERLQDDDEIVKASLKRHGRTLMYASDRMKDNEKMVTLALKQDSSALKFASERLKNDKQFILVSAQKYQGIIEYAGENLKNDKEIAALVVQLFPFDFQYLGDNLKKDRTFVTKVLKQNGTSLRYIDQSLQSDRNLVLIAVKSNPFAIRDVNDVLRNDKEIALAAVTSNGRYLQYVSDELKDNKEVVHAAVKHTNWALDYASERLKRDKDILNTIRSNQKVSWARDDEEDDTEIDDDFDEDYNEEGYTVVVKFSDGKKYRYNTRIEVSTGDKVKVEGKMSNDIGEVVELFGDWDDSDYMREVVEKVTIESDKDEHEK